MRREGRLHGYEFDRKTNDRVRACSQPINRSKFRSKYAEEKAGHPRCYDFDRKTNDRVKRGRAMRREGRLHGYEFDRKTDDHVIACSQPTNLSKFRSKYSEEKAGRPRCYEFNRKTNDHVRRERAVRREGRLHGYEFDRKTDDHVRACSQPTNLSKFRSKYSEEKARRPRCYEFDRKTNDRVRACMQPTPRSKFRSKYMQKKARHPRCKSLKKMKGERNKAHGADMRPNHKMHDWVLRTPGGSGDARVARWLLAEFPAESVETDPVEQRQGYSCLDEALRYFLLKKALQIESVAVAMEASLQVASVVVAMEVEKLQQEEELSQ